MTSPATELARRLAQEVEAVCRHYLSNGRRQGGYWIAGDVHNARGRSLYVRLHGPTGGKGARGKWSDAATGEHGDLLDLIGLNRGLASLRDTMNEARSFLALARPTPQPSARRLVPRGSPQAARRLFAAGRPVAGTPAEAYLRARAITVRLDPSALRYHPAVYYRESEDAPRQTWPALLAAVTDLGGRITGVHRTWLDVRRRSLAPLVNPRRSLGHLLGHGVRFGRAADVLVAGEGLETMLSLRSVLPDMPMVAGLSANHLAALLPPPGLQRLYIARDNDAAGERAAARLRDRAAAAGVPEVIDLIPRTGDFNDDLRHDGPVRLLDRLRNQLAPADVLRFAAVPSGKAERLSQVEMRSAAEPGR